MEAIMKRFLHRAAALGMAVVMLLSSVSAIGLGSYQRQDSLELSATASMTHGQLVSGSKVQTENVITYQAESTLVPVVAYGTTLYGRSNLDYVANYVATTGKTVVAGVNASFFDMSTGVPIGIVLTEGVLRSSGDGNAVGFRADGTAIIGKTGQQITITYPGGTTSLSHYNKTLSKSNGAILYSRDFDTRTKNTISAYNVVIRPSSTEIIPGQTITATVESLVPNTASCDIPEGCMVLSMATDTPYQNTLQTQVAALKVGDTVQISCTINPEWADVVYAVGGHDMLVENGQALTEFTLDSANRAAARTAVGLKADGTLVLYTVDGGQSGYSTGVTLPELAQRMVDEGCVTAMNLDGGGSTTFSTQYPGDSTLTTVNRPSDGQQRKCANFIFLVRDTQPAGSAAHLHLYPYDGAVLAGSSLQMTVKATDVNYFATTVPGGLSYTASNGQVDDNGLFTAGDQAGTATVSVSGSGASGARNIRVVTDPSTITLKNETTNSAGTSVTVAAGKTLNLTAVSTYLGYTLASQDTSYTWTVTGDIGTVDETGLFTAAELTSARTGTITCTAGKTSASVQVTVSALKPEGSAIQGFESGEGAVLSGTGLTATPNANTAYVRYGKESLQLDYDLNQVTAVEAGNRQTVATMDVELPADVDTAGLWVYGDNSNNSLSLVFQTQSGTSSKWITQLNFTGWKYVTAAIPAGSTAVTGFAVTEYEDATADTGRIYVDQLIAARGALNDTTAPTLTVTASGSTVSISASDSDSGLATVEATVDGVAQTVTLTGGKGTVALPGDGQAHQVRVTVRDNCGNLSSKTVEVSGTLSNPFSDMNNHWAKTYVDYCNREGILNGSADSSGNLYYRPDDSMTRQEFTAAMVRFLGINAADYAGTALPFADAGEISSWAVDSMKAAYALGLVTGSSSNGVLYANPKDTITRQEAMTILGRTQEKGYAQDDLAAFSDAAAVSGWAREYIAAMVSRGVIAGSNGKLNPTGTVTRAQVAKMLYSLY